jgi:hypothetical protein
VWHHHKPKEEIRHERPWDKLGDLAIVSYLLLAAEHREEVVSFVSSQELAKGGAQDTIGAHMLSFASVRT